MLLASCSYEESKKYNSKLVLDDEDTSDTKKKREEVLLNIVTDNPDEVLSNSLGVVKCITSNVSPTFCPSSLKGNVFRLYNYGDDLSFVDKEVDGVIPILILPKGFSDMRKIYNISIKYPSIRFMGGNLLGIPGIKIGRYDEGKDKMSASFNGVYDIFKEVLLKDIKVQRVVSKGKSSSSVSKSTSKKLETFSKFFNTSNEF